MFKGMHKQLRILKVKTLKQRKIHQKCVRVGTNMLVKEGCEAQKWKCENSTSISVSIPAWGAAAPIPRIPKAHTISSPHSVPPPASSQFTPSPFFPLLSTSAPALCSSRRAVLFPHCLGHQQQSCQSVCGEGWWYFVWVWGCVCL